MASNSTSVFPGICRNQSHLTYANSQRPADAVNTLPDSHAEKTVRKQDPGNPHGSKLRNLLLVTLLISITVFTGIEEGYLRFFSLALTAAVVASSIVAIFLALRVTTARLLALILGTFVIEYVKETIGIRSGMWRYNAIEGAYNIGVWLWVLGSITSITLATGPMVRWLDRLRAPRWVNPMLLLAVLVALVLLLGEYRHGAGVLFWSFYGLLILISMWASTKMRFSLLASFVLSAWIIGVPSEYIGSVNSGAWTFTYNAQFPPLFLLIGCWPLEILTQYAVSAALAGEPYDPSTGGTA